MPTKKAKANNPFEIRAAGDGEAELLIYGDIGESWWGESVTAKETAEQLAAIEASKITVRINSYGGSVADGLAIFNALRSHAAEIDVRIDGVAVSIASLIAMAGDTVRMSENALFMVHAPWGGTMGNAKELREYADVLDTYAKAMSSSYVRKTGQDQDTIMALLTDGVDHYYVADEAVEFGFVDEIIEEEMAAAAGFDRSKFAISAMGATASRYKNLAAVLKQPAAVAANHQPQEEAEMPKVKENEAATDVQAADKTTAAPVAVNEEEVTARVQAQEVQRRSGIRASFAPFAKREGMQAVLDACLDDMTCSEDQASKKLLAKLGEGSVPLAGDGRVEMGESDKDKFAKGAGSAILARAQLAKDDGGNNYRGYTLLELARASLALNGVAAHGMGKLDVVAAAFTHTSSDFTSLLANVAHKAMMRGYDESEETFQAWTNVGELSDFKVSNRVDLGAFPSLSKINDGGEYTYATLNDSGETIQLATYGKKFGITRQTIINDDLSAFTRIPMTMGRAAIRTVGDLVYAVLTGNPTMSDAVALFDAAHSNLLTGAGISTSSVDAMRVGMGTQKDGDANLNIRLANLIVPIALEGLAKTVRDAENEVDASAKNSRVPNSVRGTFEVISDARLDAASASSWYGTANSAMHDTVEVSYLDGNSAPMLEQQAGWDIDGTEFKVRIDAGVSPLSYRTMAKNPN
jgi:ATP-dependent protease ClpP protease subunit